MASGIRWIRPPSVLVEAIDTYGKSLLDAILAVLQRVAAEAQNKMRIEARWTDRTGNARAGLLGVAERLGPAKWAIYLVHSVFYGVFLELRWGGRLAIVYPTLLETGPAVMVELKAVLN